MKVTRSLALVLAAVVPATLFLISCATESGTAVVPLEIPGAHFVGNQACADCHKDIVRKFPASPHARVHFENPGVVGETGCESCHGPGSKHIESGGKADFIINPRNDPSSCFQCHLDIHAEFSLPQHHPVIEGNMNCVQCHDPHGGDIFKPSGGGLAMSRQDESCAQCHREQTRPFVFEHPAMREGCALCHNPHGSVNRKMLVESDPNLCLRCHAQVQSPNTAGQIYIGSINHTGFLRVGTCWTSGCHTAIHGSNIDPRLRY